MTPFLRENVQVVGLILRPKVVGMRGPFACLNSARLGAQMRFAVFCYLDVF